MMVRWRQCRLTRREEELLRMPGPAWLKYITDDPPTADRLEGLLRRYHHEHIYFPSYETTRLIFARCTPKQLIGLVEMARRPVQVIRYAPAPCRVPEEVFSR